MPSLSLLFAKCAPYVARDASHSYFYSGTMFITLSQVGDGSRQHGRSHLRDKSSLCGSSVPPMARGCHTECPADQPPDTQISLPSAKFISSANCDTYLPFPAPLSISFRSSLKPLTAGSPVGLLPNGGLEPPISSLWPCTLLGTSIEGVMS